MSVFSKSDTITESQPVIEEEKELETGVQEEEEKPLADDTQAMMNEEDLNNDIHKLA